MAFPNYYSIMLFTKNQAYILMAVTLVVFLCWYQVINKRSDRDKH
jgi:hypothetical protein